MAGNFKMVIDIGNTRTKIALYEGQEIITNFSVKGNFSKQLSKIVSGFGLPESCLVSTVTTEDEELELALQPLKDTKVIHYRNGLNLPVRILYQTPESLGSDRVANACGAWVMFPKRNNLIIDLGTCIKYDFVSSDRAYHGGGISPGLGMRYKALTRFTSSLPYFKPDTAFPELLGQSTEGSIRSGVENGMLAELNGIISGYSELFDQTQIIVTGGDMDKFADKLKSAIFVAPNLTLSGLKEILDHNDQ